MDMFARAKQIEESGFHVCHMEAGLPSTGAPQKVIQAATAILQDDKLGYTNALGVKELRETIAENYFHKYGVQVSSSRIVIRTGSSAAFMLAFLGCFDPNDCVGLASAGYPCYRNIMMATNLNYVSIPVNQEYKVTARELLRIIQERKDNSLPPLRGLIMSSPSNPTGAMLSPEGSYF